MRRILCGLIGIAIVATATAALAQTPAAKPAALKLTHATPGMNIDVYMDSGKAGTISIGSNGEGELDLDFLSLGKPKGQVYIETCKDGQRIRIISDGTTVPNEDGCNRKPVGVLFTFTCTGKITINFAAAKASFAGCANLFTTPKFLGPTLGGLVVTGFVVSRDGSTPSAPVSASPTPAATVTSALPTIVATPVTPPAAAPAPSAPAPTTPAPPTVGSPVGTQTVGSCAVGSDPGLHNAVLRFCELVRQLTIIGSTPGLMNVQATAVWFPLSGPYDQTSGRFDLSGTSTLSGTTLTGVLLRFSGTIDSAGNMTGTVTIGGQGLPGGQAITYNITTRK